jgi:hypothetical protein
MPSSPPFAPATWATRAVDVADRLLNAGRVPPRRRTGPTNRSVLP